MPPPGTNSQPVAVPDSLPLFRPEALAAQGSQQGEILLIRPLSLALLIWLGIGVGTSILALLFFARIPDAASVNSVLLPTGAGRPGAPWEASFDVPSSLSPFVKTGTSLVIRCPGCNDAGQKLKADVVRTESTGSQPIRATVALSPEIASTLHSDSASGISVQVEIPTGRTSLIHWLLKPSSQ